MSKINKKQIEAIGLKHGLAMHDPIHRYHIENAMQEYAELYHSQFTGEAQGKFWREVDITKELPEESDNRILCKTKGEGWFYWKGTSILKHPELFTHWLEAVTLPAQGYSKEDIIIALDEIMNLSQHGIPLYAYGDNEAACRMADNLHRIYGIVFNLVNSLTDKTTHP